MDGMDKETIGCDKGMALGQCGHGSKTVDELVGNKGNITQSCTSSTVGSGNAAEVRGVVVGKTEEAGKQHVGRLEGGPCALSTVPRDGT